MCVCVYIYIYSTHTSTLSNAPQITSETQNAFCNCTEQISICGNTTCKMAGYIQENQDSN